jgi:hypothetical protein
MGLMSLLVRGGLGEEKRKKNSDLVIDRSVELLGYTPDEKSDRNLEWMLENGYSIRHRRGGRGHPRRADFTARTWL